MHIFSCLREVYWTLSAAQFFIRMIKSSQQYIELSCGREKSKLRVTFMLYFLTKNMLHPHHLYSNHVKRFLLLSYKCREKGLSDEPMTM